MVTSIEMRDVINLLQANGCSQAKFNDKIVTMFGDTIVTKFHDKIVTKFHYKIVLDYGEDIMSRRYVALIRYQGLY